jgi:hypothetical protein
VHGRPPSGAGTGRQIPIDPASAQLWQVPSHRLWQQIPCAQKPLRHSASVVQACSFRPQLPFTQALPSTQSPSVLQVVRHSPSSAAQAYGAQLVVARTQVPTPLHLAVLAYIPSFASRQAAAAHGVPTG